VDLTISSEHADDATVIRVSGELDLATVDELRGPARRAIADSRGRDLVLDLSGLDFIDSIGIGALIELRAAADQGDARLVLLRPSRRVVEVLQLTGLSQVFEILG
jgi:anti-sigma B factor antagonist